MGALEALSTGGFLASEVTDACGEREADRLRASSGRTGLLGHVLRVAEQIGIPNDELETKERYEQALRDGQVVLMVLAPTEERKMRAADLLRAHSGHFINFLGRFTREEIAS